MKRLMRKYHRSLSLLITMPLFLTIVTGMLVTIIKELTIGVEFPIPLLLKIHTGEIFHLQSIYPFLNGVGLIELLTKTKFFRLFVINFYHR